MHQFLFASGGAMKVELMSNLKRQATKIWQS